VNGAASPVTTADKAPAAPPAPPTTPPASSTAPSESPPEQANADAHATRGLDMGAAPSSKVEPTHSIPTPAAADATPHTGPDTSLRAIPPDAPVGHLGKELLESPLKDPKRFQRCNVPKGTRLEISAVIYNGAAVGVDVHATPTDRALSFCIERVVRETSWVKELAVNRVRVTL
jgi:hypothetical protein